MINEVFEIKLAPVSDDKLGPVMFSQHAQRRLALAWGSVSLLGLAASLSGCSGPKLVQLDRERPVPSAAETIKAYRADAAKHLYALSSSQIFKGKLPPLLHAIAVVRVEIAENGDLISIDWMRKPSHAPEVVLAIEQKIHAAEPFPAPVKLGPLTYTETWLWHKSGRFQLDTLTEGQI